MPGVGWIIDNYNHSKYETTPFEQALKSAFSDDQYLFGGRRLADTQGFHTKVAVIATSASGNPVVLANYNRPCDEKRKSFLLLRSTLCVLLIVISSCTSVLQFSATGICHG